MPPCMGRTVHFQLYLLHGLNERRRCLGGDLERERTILVPPTALIASSCSLAIWLGWKLPGRPLPASVLPAADVWSHLSPPPDLGRGFV